MRQAASFLSTGKVQLPQAGELRRFNASTHCGNRMLTLASLASCGGYGGTGTYGGGGGGRRGGRRPGGLVTVGAAFQFVSGHNGARMRLSTPSPSVAPPRGLYRVLPHSVQSVGSPSFGSSGTMTGAGRTRSRLPSRHVPIRLRRPRQLMTARSSCGSATPHPLQEDHVMAASATVTQAACALCAPVWHAPREHDVHLFPFCGHPGGGRRSRRRGSSLAPPLACDRLAHGARRLAAVHRGWLAPGPHFRDGVLMPWPRSTALGPR